MDDAIRNHPDFSLYSPNELKDTIRELQEKITYASSKGGEAVFVAWLLQERRLAEKELFARNGNAAPKQVSFWPEILSAKQLIELPPDPTRWVWENCLPIRATSALIAKSYTGKSTFAASLCIAVARGIKFLGRPTQRGAVLYVYLDGPRDELKENLLNTGMLEEDEIYTYAGRKPDQVLDWVKENVRLKNVKLLIVDTAQKFFGFKEDKYEEKINKMQPMLDLCDEYDFHAMFTYHAAKNSGNTISALGSVAVEANARVSLYIRRLGESQQRIFETEQNTGKKFEPIGLSAPDEGFIRNVGNLWEIEINEAGAAAMELIKETPGIVEADIRSQTGIKGKIMSRALKKLREENKVERTGKGVKGNVFHYYLAGELFKNQTSENKVTNLFKDKPEKLF